MDEAEVQKYRTLLAKHDWHYEYSDDRTVWGNGKAEKAALETLQMLLDPDYKIWDEYAPREYKRGKPKS